ncbi:MAG: Cardiolipin synthase B [Syntrophus sp. SKADARSKE-3]|nr:Cardiolipin synthase B [Syntrophus sp. SKADARSKE-3]
MCTFLYKFSMSKRTMKIYSPNIFLIILVAFFTAAPGIHAAQYNSASNVNPQAFFSPGGGCTEAILKAVSQARTEILIMAYSFHSPAIAQALIAAHKRGVKVSMILDKSERQEGLTPPIQMFQAGIPVYLDGTHAVMNNRLIIIDGQTIITGSFNFNAASENMNAENLLIIQAKELAASYRENWLHHKKHSISF